MFPSVEPVLLRLGVHVNLEAECNRTDIAHTEFTKIRAHYPSVVPVS